MQLRGDRLHLIRGGLHGYTVAQSADSEEVVKGSRLLVRAERVNGNPELRVAGWRECKRAR